MRTRDLSRFLLALLVASVFVAAGCGSDDDDGGGGSGGGGGDSTEESGGDEAAFIEAADEICKDNEDLGEDVGQVIADFADSDSPVGLEDVVETLDEFVSESEDALEELQDLEPPDDLAEDWENALELQEEQIEGVGDIRDLAEDRQSASTSFEEDAAALQEALGDPDFEDRADELEELAEEIGLEECGSQN